MTGRKRWIAGTAAAIVLLAVGYLAGFFTPALTAPGDNSAEAGFARDMSTHHAQAVAMSMIAWQNATNPDVKQLAYAIATTQQAQVGMMQTWLKDWNLQPTGSKPPMSWMPGGAEQLVGGLMPGMATTDQLNELTAAKGKQVDILFCQLMLRHHLGGIHMVQGVLQVTKDKNVRELAEAMLNGQESEVNSLQNLLKDLGAQPLTS